jgi:hypothetical protein
VRREQRAGWRGMGQHRGERGEGAMAAGAPLIGAQLQREHFGAGSMGLARYGQN